MLQTTILLIIIQPIPDHEIIRHYKSTEIHIIGGLFNSITRLIQQGKYLHIIGTILKDQLDEGVEGTAGIDDVLNNQRNVVYARRKHALLGDQLRTDLLGMLESLTEEWVAEYVAMGDYQGLHSTLLRNLAVDVFFDEDEWRSMGEDELVDMIVRRALEVYKRKEDKIGNTQALPRI